MEKRTRDLSVVRNGPSPLLHTKASQGHAPIRSLHKGCLRRRKILAETAKTVPHEFSNQSNLSTGLQSPACQLQLTTNFRVFLDPSLWLSREFATRLSETTATLVKSRNNHDQNKRVQTARDPADTPNEDRFPEQLDEHKEGKIMSIIPNPGPVLIYSEHKAKLPQHRVP